MVELAQANVSQGDVVELTGLSRTTIWAIEKEHGIVRYHRGGS